MSSLIPFSVANSPRDKLNGPSRGEVVDNKDPLQLGRVRIKISGMIEGDTESLPWVYPEKPTAAQGGTNKAASHHVPRIGSELQINFPQGNVYSLFYTGYWHSADNQDMSNFKDNYPNKQGSQTRTGNSFVHDLTSHDVTYTHRAVDDDESSDPQTLGDDGSAPSGGTSYSAKRFGDDSGTTGSSSGDAPGTKPAKLTMNVDKDGTLNITSKKDHNSTFDGNVTITAKGDMNIKGKKIYLN